MEFALLSGLSEDDKRQVLMAARRRRFGRREVIFHEGDPGEALHLVDSGHVALRVTTPTGDVGLVRIVAAGDFFGELALLSDGPRSATALAIETVETLSIARADFAALRTRTIATGDFVANALAVEVRRLSAAHVEAMFLPVDKRVFRRLASSARRSDRRRRYPCRSRRTKLHSWPGRHVPRSTASSSTPRRRKPSSCHAAGSTCSTWPGWITAGAEPTDNAIGARREPS